ncbi:MAG TPA: HPr family phosphocarrier protein [Gammaproteobacteria bacterium]|jgi:phosphocarrier protein
MIEKELTIVNKLGLHARAAAKLVSLASSFKSNIELEKDSRVVNGKSIMGVMMLAASQGTKVKVRVEGVDEEEAVHEIEALIADRFGEEQ